MNERDFIVTYLNKERSENIKSLISANINNSFQLDLTSTNISNKLDELLSEEKEKDSSNNIDESVKKQIDRIFEKGKNNRVKKYINDDIKINLFPYEPKKLKRKDENENNKINELEPENNEIFDILNKITKLNEDIKKYKIKNKEKDSEISIEADIESNDMDID